DVLGRYIAMHDRERPPPLVLALVSVMEPFGSFGDDECSDEGWDPRPLRSGGGHELAEVEALDVLHREEQAVIAVIRELVNLDDVRMIETGRQVCFFHEHRTEAARRTERRQNTLDDEELECALRTSLLGEEDLRHSAGAEPAKDLEVGELSGVFGH